MPTLETLKDRIEQEASQQPEKFFAVDAIKRHGFHRVQCQECGKHFWTVQEDRTVCGEPACAGGYTFINDPPTEKTFSFETAWTEFSAFMEDRGHTPINRYPVAARWRNDTEFVRASIYDFQPYVVSGEVDPPANPLVVPQFCVRFNDIDNVGITGRHYTGFIMTGQHAFTEPEEYDQDKYFEDMLQWLLEGMEIPKEKIILHEDSWGGGGNLGACMEFFVDGLELFNQVYMFYEADDSEKSYSELDTKVLDMGMGHERIVWITHGSETSYEANMPTVVERLYERTGVEPDKDIWRAFLPHSGLLNFDEVDDLEATWQEIADRMGVEKERLQDEIMPAAALYSIADHTRSLLIAFADGVLPSNTGEKHSLRVIARRCFDFIDRYGWDLDLRDVMAWHADEMAGVYPELEENLEQAQQIIQHEQKKYRQMREKAERTVEGLREEEIDEDKMIELYDSQGISPGLLQRLGFDIEPSNDFYAKVAERHRDGEQEHATETGQSFDLEGIADTEYLFRESEKQTDFDATVLRIIEQDDSQYVVLDRTCFYPTSGGQLHDTGQIDGNEVIDVIKQNGIVLHELEEVDFQEEDTVHGSIDRGRRQQLMQHHTATHLVNGAAKKVLGDHIWQAGAKKTTEKARLDVTHYENIDRETLKAIQQQANRWIQQGLPVTKETMEKSAAEQEYGFRLYQGGVPPGNELRVVNVGDGLDVEACGGTHVDTTSEIGEIILTGTKKIQDGVIRLEFKAGEAAQQFREYRSALEDELGTWIDTEEYTLDMIADIFDVEVDNLPGVVERFVDEWDDQRSEIWELEPTVKEPLDHDYDERPRDPQRLFDQWKQQKKDIERLEEEIENEIKHELVESDKAFIEEDLQIKDVGTLIQIAQHVAAEDREKAVLLKGKNAVIAARGEESSHDIQSAVEEYAAVIQGDEDFVKGFNLKQ
jgi:alanyl-tRNA synthetase